MAGTGHSHPHVVAALRAQADKLLFYSNLVYSETRARAAKKLADVSPASLTKVFFCNSGTEANENAMRMARLSTGRQNVITFSGGFHGRTADAISATFLGSIVSSANQTSQDIWRPNSATLNRYAKSRSDRWPQLCWSRFNRWPACEWPSPSSIRPTQLCEERGIVLIYDEVQTGVGRTGEWFFAGSNAGAGIVPDIITLAKALGSGIPVGACLVSEAIAKQIKENDLGTTFGGGMMAMAAVTATLEAIEDDNMLANVKNVEGHLRESLAAVPGIVEVRGKGFLLGLRLNAKAADIHRELLERRIITGTSSDPHVLRLLPPLCLKERRLICLCEKCEQY